MNKTTTTSSCGTISILNELRESQDTTKNQQSTLDSYINKNKKQRKDNFQNSLQIYEVETNKIIRWKHKDRPENETGNIEELAETFKTIGQQQPCIVRPSPKKDKYELIVGERRWLAAQLANLKLKVIVQSIDDRVASLIQAIENEKRADLSEFAKGVSYYEKIKAGFITQKDLIEILQVPKMQVTRLLSFSKIPKDIKDAIQDFRQVSARTAYEIVRFSRKGSLYKDIIIKMADKIRSGNCGHKSIEKEIQKITEANEKSLNSKSKIVDNKGNLLFTWKISSDGSPSIKLRKDIHSYIKENDKNIEKLMLKIKQQISSLNS